jgi:hypothetical protein
VKSKPFLDRLRADVARVRLDRLERLQGLTESLSAATTREDVTRVIFDRGLALADAGAVTVFWERQPGEIELVHGLGVSDEFVRRFRCVDADELAPVAEAYRTGEPVWLASREETAERFRPSSRFPSEAIHACRDPLVSEARGAIGLQFLEPRAFDGKSAGSCSRSSGNASSARAARLDAQKRLLERLQQVHSTASRFAATGVTTWRRAFRALGPRRVCRGDPPRRGLSARRSRRHGRPAEGPRSVVIDAPPAAESCAPAARWPDPTGDSGRILSSSRARSQGGGLGDRAAAGVGQGGGGLAQPLARRGSWSRRSLLHKARRAARGALSRRVRLLEEAERAAPRRSGPRRSSGDVPRRSRRAAPSIAICASSA